MQTPPATIANFLHPSCLQVYKYPWGGEAIILVLEEKEVNATPSHGVMLDKHYRSIFGVI